MSIIAYTWKEDFKQIFEKDTYCFKSKMKALVARKNSPTHKLITKSLNTSTRTINK